MLPIRTVEVAMRQLDLDDKETNADLHEQEDSMASNRSESDPSAVSPSPVSPEEAGIATEPVGSASSDVGSEHCQVPRATRNQEVLLECPKDGGAVSRDRIACPLCDICLPPDRLKVHLSRTHGI
jgi:hypothetical protein